MDPESKNWNPESSLLGIQPFVIVPGPLFFWKVTIVWKTRAARRRNKRCHECFTCRDIPESSMLRYWSILGINFKPWMQWRGRIISWSCGPWNKGATIKKNFKEQQVSSTQQRILSSYFILRPVSSDHTEFIREYNKTMKGNLFYTYALQYKSRPNKSVNNRNLLAGYD